MNLVDFQTDITIRICDYAVLHNIEPDDLLMETAVNLIQMLGNTTFNDWRKKRCKTCKYHDDFSAVCVCGDSERRANFTDNDDVCEFWEVREDYV